LKYRMGLYLNSLGLIALAGIFLIETPKWLDSYEKSQIHLLRAKEEQSRLRAEADIDQETAKLSRQRSDTYKDNQSFSIWGYTDNSHYPPTIDFRAFPDPNQKVWIFDGSNSCLGYVKDRQFYWKHRQNNSSVCEELKNG
jgi:hypothetical protein